MIDPVYAQFNQQALDREYSPSSRIDDIGYYLDAYKTLSATARHEAADMGRCELDLAYGSAARQRMDLFLPETSGPHPLQVFIHGGFWQQLSKNESSFAAPMFLRNEIAFAALNYTLAPEVTVQNIVDEVRSAVAWIYHHADRYSLDRQRIFLSGHSAGAHLCTMMLATEWESRELPADVVKGICAVSGVYDLEPVRLSYVNDVARIAEHEVLSLSPLRQATSSPCPVVLAYGDNETPEFKRQTNEFLNKLHADGVQTAFTEVHDRNHFDVILDLCNADSWLARQVVQQVDDHA